jgi:multidrug efflux pump subunit AcrB
MSSVRIPLGHRYIFLMLALLGLLVGARFLSNEPTTRLLYSETTVFTVKWTITGLNVRGMEERVTSSYEHALSLLVDQAQGVESHTSDGLVIVKIILRPGADLDRAYDQVAAASEALRCQFQVAIQPSRDDT